MFLIYGGHGTDGGFGDYAPPRWSRMPLKCEANYSTQGQYVWFETEDEAKKVVDSLNAASRKVFYASGTHGSYDGEFPYEYEYREIPKIDNPPFSADAGIMVLTDEEAWQSFDYDCDEDYEDEYEEDEE